MWPLGVENAPQKAPNLLPGGLWAAFGVPGGPWGAKADFLAILSTCRPNKGPKRALEAHFQSFSTLQGVQKDAKQLKINEIMLFRASGGPGGTPKSRV